MRETLCVIRVRCEVADVDIGKRAHACMRAAASAACVEALEIGLKGSLRYLSLSPPSL